MKDNLKALLGCIKYNRGDELCNIFEDLLRYVKGLEEDRDNALKQMNEWDKDEELVSLRKKLKALRKSSDFVLSEDEEQKISEWVKKHNASEHGSCESSAIGGRYTYKFTPTSIGTVGEIECTCGKKFTFRDL